MYIPQAYRTYPLGASEGFYMRELETLHGIPDLVILDAFASTQVSFINAVNTSPSTSSFASVYMALKSSRTAKSVGQIELETGYSYDYVSSVLNSLLTNNLINTTEESKYLLNSTAKLPRCMVISVEFKIHNWRKALNQALRHKSFADKSYVIMPTYKKTILEQNIEQFRTHGISVAVFDSMTGKLTFISKRAKPRKSNKSYVDVLGRFWSREESFVKFTS